MVMLKVLHLIWVCKPRSNFFSTWQILLSSNKHNTKLMHNAPKHHSTYQAIQNVTLPKVTHSYELLINHWKATCQNYSRFRVKIWAELVCILTVSWCATNNAWFVSSGVLGLRSLFFIYFSLFRLIAVYAATGSRGINFFSVALAAMLLWFKHHFKCTGRPAPHCATGREKFFEVVISCCLHLF